MTTIGIDASTVRIEERDGATRISVHAKPRASKSAIVGVRAGALEVAIAAPPVEGEANAELVRIIAKALGVARGQVEVVVGATGRQKVVEIRALDAATARERLAAAR